MKRYDSVMFRATEIENTPTIAGVVEYETAELCDTTVLRGILRNYRQRLSVYLRTQISELIEEVEAEGEVGNVFELQTVAKYIVKELKAIFGEHVRYCAWLCPEETAVNVYGGDPDDLYEYETSEYPLAERKDGSVLFAYPHPPKSVY